MTNFAYVENGEIKQVLHTLPKNWLNVSNFFAIDNESVLNQYGWYTVQRTVPVYDPNMQLLGDPIRTFADGVVTETIPVVNKPAYPPPPPPPTAEQIAAEAAAAIAAQWDVIRAERDQKMRDFEWRYVRNARQTRMNLPVTDNIVDLDTYMQALADITTQEDPYNIVWPDLQVTPIEGPQGPQGE